MAGLFIAMPEREARRAAVRAGDSLARLDSLCPTIPGRLAFNLSHDYFSGHLPNASRPPPSTQGALPRNIFHLLALPLHDGPPPDAARTPERKEARTVSLGFGSPT